MIPTGNYFGHWNKRITRNQYLAWLTVRAYALVTPVTSYAVWSRVFLVGFSGSRSPSAAASAALAALLPLVLLLGLEFPGLLLVPWVLLVVGGSVSPFPRLLSCPSSSFSLRRFVPFLSLLRSRSQLHWFVGATSTRELDQRVDLQRDDGFDFCLMSCQI